MDGDDVDHWRTDFMSWHGVILSQKLLGDENSELSRPDEQAKGKINAEVAIIKYMYLGNELTCIMYPLLIFCFSQVLDRVFHTFTTQTAHIQLQANQGKYRQHEYGKYTNVSHFDYSFH